MDDSMDASKDEILHLSFWPVTLMRTDTDGNAFNLLGAFAAKAREQGWSEDAIADVQHEAMAGNYDHLLRTLAKYADQPSDTGA
jgi:hypothetical protein